MKSHGDEIALNFTFYDVLTQNETSFPNQTREKLIRLRHGCLDPGLYYKHTKSWLKYFPARKLIFLDGHLLRSQPHLVLDHLQKFVSPTQMVNYSRLLVYDKKKGFFCVRRPKNENRTRICLGASKGRQYDRRLDEKSRIFLNSFYAESNSKFAKLLKMKFFPNSQWPSWLN